MKRVYRPLTQSTQPRDRAAVPTAKKGSFQQMLSQHLRVARGQETSRTNTATNPGGNKWYSIYDEDASEALEILKSLDSKYYQQGVKKKTLAATFSSRHSASLNERVKRYKHLIEAKAKKYGLDPNLLAGLVRQESNFNPYAVSHCGAMGLGQLMPETARSLGVKDPFNAAQNLEATARYLKEQLDTFGGDLNKALAAYNAGPAAVKLYGGVPPYRETQNYVRAIQSHYGQIAKLDLFAKKGTGSLDF